MYFTYNNVYNVTKNRFQLIQYTVQKVQNQKSNIKTGFT